MTGRSLIGRVVGFEGDLIEGRGRVEARPGRIRVTELSPGLDGSVAAAVSLRPVSEDQSAGRVRAGVSRGRSGPFYPLATTCRHSRRRARAASPRSGLSRSGSAADRRRRCRRTHASGLRERGFLQGRGMPCQRSTPDSDEPPPRSAIELGLLVPLGVDHLDLGGVLL